MAYDMNRLVRNEVDYEKLLRCILLNGHYLTAYPFMFDSSISGTTVGETLLDAVKHCHNLNQESKLMQPRPQGSLNSKNMDRKSMLTIKLYNKCLKVMSQFPGQSNKFYAKKLHILLSSLYRLKHKFSQINP